MDFIDEIKNLSARAEKLGERLHTEEATKNALVMPFISALGYDVFNPLEVVPEFTADVGIKKKEKVDYAILRDGVPLILVECKGVDADLEKLTPSQLYRYFSVTEARFSVFTNGLHYQFFSDLDAPNKMDTRPFLEFDIRNLSERSIGELNKFRKDTFDLDDILSTASDLKYTRGIKRSLAEEWLNPSEEFVKLLTNRVYDGRLTQSVKEQFVAITKRAFQEFVSDRVQKRLTSALEKESDRGEPLHDDELEPEEVNQEVVTTDEEIEAYYVVKSIVREVVAANRIYIRDTLSYCGILLDDNNRKPICRLLFNSSNKRIALFDKNKQATKHSIQDINDIYQFADVLKATAKQYDAEPDNGSGL